MGDIELEEEVVLDDIDLDVVYLGEMTTDHSKLENLSYEASNHTGFQKEINNNNKLSSDLVDDTDTENKFVTSEDISNWNTKVDKNVDDLTYYYTKTDVDGKISSVYRYKGTVAAYADLPDTGLTVGDVYNVETDGNNYAWNGTVWDKLGGDIDLSGYQTKIDSAHKLDADFVDDTNSVNKFVTSAEKEVWNDKLNFVKTLEISEKRDITTFSKGLYILSFSGNGYLYYVHQPHGGGESSEVRITNFTSKIGVAFLFVVEDFANLKDEDMFCYYLNNKGDISVLSYELNSLQEYEIGTNAVNTNSIQTIGAKKTFTVLPESSVTPTDDNQLVNKKYVDDAVSTAGGINVYEIGYSDSSSLYMNYFTNWLNDYNNGIKSIINLFYKNKWCTLGVNFSITNGNGSINLVSDFILGNTGNTYGGTYQDANLLKRTATVTNNEITQVGNWSTQATFYLMNANVSQVLHIGNTKAFIPTSNYHPANKKYVDDSITAAVGNISTVLSSLTTVQGGE